MKKIGIAVLIPIIAIFLFLSGYFLYWHARYETREYRHYLVRYDKWINCYKKIESWEDREENKRFETSLKSLTPEQRKKLNAIDPPANKYKHLDDIGLFKEESKKK